MSQSEPNEDITKQALIVSQNNNTKTHAIWIRVSAFLSSRAPNTAITYSSILKEWCSFLHSEAGTNHAAQRILSATEIHALAYRSWLEEQPGQKPRLQTTVSVKKRALTTKKKTTFKKQKKDGLNSTLTNATIWKKFSALRRIYRVIISADLGITINPFDTDRAPPPPKDSGKKRPTEMVEFEFVMKVVEQPDINSPKGRRDRGILSVLFGAGLRRSEVVGLRIGDLRKTRTGTPFLYLRATKGRKDAEQAIPKWAEESLKAVIQNRKQDGALSGDYIFISYRGKGAVTATEDPISDSGVYKLFKQYCLLAGAGQFLTPHSARATAITKLLVDGLNHREVQEFSRHSSVQMVEAYDKRRLSVDENPGKKLKF